MPTVTARLTDDPVTTTPVLPAAFLDNRWKPGVSGNPGGRTVRETEVRKLAQQLSEDAMIRIGEIMKSTEDERASLIAAGMILDRAYGKPKEMPEDTRKALIDVARLGPERLAMLSELLRAVVQPPESNATDVVEQDPIAHNVKTPSVQKP